MARLDALVTSIANAVIEAEHTVRQYQVGNLSSAFFESVQAGEGTPGALKPRVLPLRIQSLRPDAKKGDLDELSVPLLALTNPQHLSITDVEIKFSVVLGDVTQSSERLLKLPDSAGPEPVDVSRLGITASLPPLKQDSTTGTVAQVTLHVQAGEPAEGLARVMDRLNKLI